ncbi:4a-hydroxytetrahydrobiopterin dehydratase [Palleronia caenipelagi]|uniref:Putative pterin-4-alpha-carbinolamine dehydratase n=1 Tax=Palleronia caenipelagi TaxID=2489174 RepID=A0A547Q7S5_9RHOB|nr:4a-hydroxytetrahydrobiopterin dehydratase [Palleronia caenipelagi]TRD22411.1 4a-hydroxytetrahydrobiopterin dehydratase [Palleronia caenipelagi]
MDDAAMKDTLEKLEKRGWTVSSDPEAISKTFEFKDFTRAFGWMTMVATRAEKIGHHPDWSNSYNKVDVSLTTHDSGGLTDKDLRLAKMMDQLA